MLQRSAEHSYIVALPEITIMDARFPAFQKLNSVPLFPQLK
jgi:hypothetical protein